MSEEDKYYTPTFEDFIPNLEYEYFDGREWVKKVYDNLEHRAKDTMKLHYELKLNKDRFRIKYLDQSDIESLGYNHFKHNPKGVFSAVDYYKGYSAGLTHYHNTNTVIVYEQLQGNMEGDTWFRGKIKNKTELKRLLKQLGL
jgi:hypothetical protein